MNDSMKIIRSDMSLSNLLELAANNDVDGFKQLITRIPSAINEVGFWYGRQRSSKRMLMEQRTPLMIAATYGSLDVVKLILSYTEVDVNKSCGPDKTTALHCAFSGGSSNAFDVVKILLISGADPELVDADGRRAIDVLLVPPNLPNLKNSLEKLLKNSGFCEEQEDDLGFDLTSFKSNEKKEYPVYPFFPDLKSDAYSTDEFRMFAFKIRPCSRAYSHDWTECPFIHPGESARRRDPRKIHYSCVPCPDFKKGQCRRGDLCEFAHGVFECWLHPAQYRTRLCKDGTFCARRVCFFAHTPEELRPLYVSTGSAMPSPRGSPAAASMSPPFSPPPMLQLHGGNFQASRLRLSFNARDAHAEELKLLLDLEMHQRQQAAIFSPVAAHQLPPVNPYSPKGLDYWGSPRVLEQPHLSPFSPRFSNYAKKVDWSVTGGEPAPARFQSTEPDVSWVQSLVKEPPSSAMESPENEKTDHAALGLWLENMQLDQIVA